MRPYCQLLFVIIGFVLKYLSTGSINDYLLHLTFLLVLGNVSPFNQGEPEELTGKTLEVYNLLMELNEWIGVREVQRILNYSSSNLAFYHLNKLYELDMANKSDDNKYAISQKGIEKKFGPYQDRFSLMGEWISDFYLFFLVFGILTLLTFAFFVLQIDGDIWFFIFFPIMSSLTYFYWIRAKSLEQLPKLMTTKNRQDNEN